MNKTEYIKSLRELADFVEARTFPEEWNGTYEFSYPRPTLSLFTQDKSAFSRALKAVGTGKKEASSSYLSLSSQGHSFLVDINAYRAAVCERIVTGTKIVPAKEEKLLPAEPEHEEETFTWKCPDSFMALADEEK